MAKPKANQTSKNNNHSSEPRNEAPPAFSPPKGFQKQGGDIDGFWTGEKPLTFIPRTAKVWDKKDDKYRPQLLIIGEVAPGTICDAVTSDGEVIVLDEGKTVAFFAKPGMRELTNCKNAVTWMAPAGEKDIGKQKPMKLYDIYSKGDGQRLTIGSDLREHSAGVPTFLDPKGYGKGSTGDDNSMPIDPKTGRPLF